MGRTQAEILAFISGQAISAHADALGRNKSRPGSDRKKKESWSVSNLQKIVRPMPAPGRKKRIWSPAQPTHSGHVQTCTWSATCSLAPPRHLWSDLYYSLLCPPSFITLKINNLFNKWLIGFLFLLFLFLLVSWKTQILSFIICTNNYVHFQFYFKS